ncbi:MAG: TIGR02466 family protein [Pseudobdellovibrio sp.]
MIKAFVTQIYQDRLLANKKDLAKLNNHLVDDVENIMATDRSGHQWSKSNYIEGYTSYGSIDKLHLIVPTFVNLEKKMRIHISQYIKELEYDISIKDLTMTHCWVNVMPSGAQHTSHIHPLSVISGTYYLQVPKGASSIKFEDPRLGFLMNAPSVKTQAKNENKRFISVLPQEGDLILFESWIRHEVPRNLTNDPRVSISFNYGWNK